MQVKTLQEEKKEHDRDMGRKLFDMEKFVKDTGKSKYNLETDVRSNVI
jgi:hypothetical protein